MSLLRKIKKFLGLELPHLLEDEDEQNDIDIKHRRNLKSLLGIASPSRDMYNVLNLETAKYDCLSKCDDLRKLSELASKGRYHYK